MIHILNNESIFSWFCAFSGLKAHEAQQWRLLCESSARLVQSRLREDVCIEADMERVCMAAASVAYNTWLPIASGGSFSGGQIRVGDIALMNAPSGGANTGSYDLLSQIADLLIPEGFAFVQTHNGVTKRGQAQSTKSGQATGSSVSGFKPAPEVGK